MLRTIVVIALVVVVGIAAGQSSLAQQSGVSTPQDAPVDPPPLTEGQKAVLARDTVEMRTFLEWRYWMGLQPPAVQARWQQHYERFLERQGVGPDERSARLKVLASDPARFEVEMWNRRLTAEKPGFNTAPNAFLVRMLERLQPGRALDVGMGQGRNALHLASVGWRVTGFDPADRAVAVAQRTADAKNLPLRTVVAGRESFEWGDAAWDLIVCSYVTVRDDVATIERALAPGGVVVVEAFHRDATLQQSIGGGVVYDTNELLTLFPKLRVLHYEDVDAVPDFSNGKTSRVVRLMAQRP